MWVCGGDTRGRAGLRSRRRGRNIETETESVSGGARAGEKFRYAARAPWRLVSPRLTAAAEPACAGREQRSGGAHARSRAEHRSGGSSKGA